MNLVDTRQLVFNRILHRDDLHVHCIQPPQGTVKRSRLAAAGGTRDQEKSVGKIEVVLHLAQQGIRKTQSRQEVVMLWLRSRRRITTLSP